MLKVVYLIFDMCLNGRFIRNKYINESFFVNCGHCEACEMQKGYRRMARIYDEVCPEHLGFFVTLTYARDFAPYFRIDDFNNKVCPLPIYRDMKLIRTKGSSRYVHEVDLLTEINIIDWYNDFKLPHLKYRSHNIGVCYFKDVQDFVKRVRIYLKRHFNYDGYFKFYACSEYGEDTCRPHFHLEIFVDNKAFMYERLYSAVVASWKMCSSNRWSKGFQLAEDPASYISSYVNSPTVVPLFLKNYFRSKHSFSKFFGFNCKSYSLAMVLSKIESGDLRYVRELSAKDVPEYVALPIPKYVINRYFPLFKGYSRLTRSEIYDVLRYPARLRDFRKEIDYSDEDIDKIIVRLRHVKDRYFPFMSDDDYAILHTKCWTSYRSTCYRLFLEDRKVPLFEKYDNLYLLDNGFVRSDIFIPDGVTLNPNEFSSRIGLHTRLTQDFYKKTKNKKVGEMLTNKVYEL